MAVIVRHRSVAQDRAVTVAWVGVMAIAGLSAWLAVVGGTDLAGEHYLWRAISGARGRMVGPGLVLFVAAVMVAEQRWPAVQRPLLARAHLVDASYLVFFAICMVPPLTLVTTGFAVELRRHAPWLVLARLPLVPQIAVVIAILVAQDAIMWCAHVANHRYKALWRLHALHHSQEDLNVLSTFRTHPLIHATYLPSALPALVLGSSVGSVPTAALVVYACLITLPHANLGWRLGPWAGSSSAPLTTGSTTPASLAPRAMSTSVSPLCCGTGWPAGPFSPRERHQWRRASATGPCPSSKPARAVPSQAWWPPNWPNHFAATRPRTVLVPERPPLVQRRLDLRDASALRDAAMAAARVALAWVFIYHGASTLFGAFHGAGLQRTATYFAAVAHLHPGLFFAWCNGITEFFGGIAVGLGVLARLAAFGLFVDMVVAMVTVSFHIGIVSGPAGTGYELNLALAGLAFVVALLGAGRASIDALAGKLLAKRWPAGRLEAPALEGSPAP